MQRRSFLKWQLQGMVWVAGGLAVPGAVRDVLAASAPAVPDVAVVKGNPGPAARAAVEMLGGMKMFVKPGQKVVIKPNMSFDKTPDAAVNTHPDVVREVLIMCKEAGAGKIMVLDHALRSPELSLQQSGILDACNSVVPGICLHLMQEHFYREASIDTAQEMKTNAFMRDVLDADVMIAVPVAKSHGSAGVSLSLKGQMGLIWDRRSMHSRYSLDNSIVDLNVKVKPHLAIIDATRVLTTGGPGGPGKVITPGEVIASKDPVAADATAVAAYEWYGRKMEPRQVGHIRLAAERGLGRMDIAALVTQRITL